MSSITDLPTPKRNHTTESGWQPHSPRDYSDSPLVAKLASLSEGGTAVLKVDPGQLPEAIQQLTRTGHHHRDGFGVRQSLLILDSAGLDRIGMTVICAAFPERMVLHQTNFPTLESCEDFIIDEVAAVAGHYGQHALLLIMPAVHDGKLPAKLRDLAVDGVGVALVEHADQGADWKLTAVKR